MWKIMPTEIRLAEPADVSGIIAVGTATWPEAYARLLPPPRLRRGLARGLDGVDGAPGIRGVSFEVLLAGHHVHGLDRYA
jgi:hypothetical protein